MVERRSGNAAVALADARNMAGGMKAWAQAGLPFADDDGKPGTVA
ncbi:hypothetical protein [Pseudonocardia kunmingensis]|nr:hypothetical protein [Pseudonocardia kunmingensis]